MTILAGVLGGRHMAVRNRCTSASFKLLRATTATPVPALSMEPDSSLPDRERGEASVTRYRLSAITCTHRLGRVGF